MTEDVAAASLRNNYQQSLALSLAERTSVRELPDYALLMRALEARGLFDRALEALPSDMELQERGRAGRGLTRPELAVLLSYAKIALQHDILESRVPDEPQLESWLDAYFPPLLRERFAAGIRRPQPAPRDHRARAHQCHRQPRRPGHGGAARRRDAPADVGRGACLHGGARGVRPACACGSASTRSTARCRARRSCGSIRRRAIW